MSGGVKKKRILVTGAAGYLARSFLRRITAEPAPWAGEVIGLDLAVPRRPVDRVEYIQVDMLSPRWTELIEQRLPDVLVHLAFVVNPMRDEGQMHRINVEGTRRTLEAAAAAGTAQVLFASSATAYGAFADNPVPLSEESPIRGHVSPFRYAQDKGELEFVCRAFARAHPGCKLSIVRPVIVFGPNVDNFLSRFIYAFPVMPLIRGSDAPLQFVHEDDVAGVMARIIEREQTGPFNVAADDWLTLEEVCRLAGRPTVRVSRRLLQLLMTGLWRVGASMLEAPPTILDFIEHPWVVSTERIRNELEYEMRYSSREALMEMIKLRE
jgi:UDP-glucose 4-epimerase